MGTNTSNLRLGAQEGDIGEIRSALAGEVSDKTVALHDAIQNGEVGAAHYLIERGAGVNDFGYTSEDSKELEESNISQGAAGAYPLAVSPLSRAIGNKNSEMMLMLLEKGATVTQGVINAAVGSMRTPVACFKILLESGDEVQCLLEEALMNAINTSGGKFVDLKTVETMLQAGVKLPKDAREIYHALHAFVRNLSNQTMAVSFDKKSGDVNYMRHAKANHTQSWDVAVKTVAELVAKYDGREIPVRNPFNKISKSERARLEYFLKTGEMPPTPEVEEKFAVVFKHLKRVKIKQK